MNENIDLTKILKDCPIGWKFYSSIYGEVEFVEVRSTNVNHPIIFKLHDITHSVSSTGEHFKGQDECTFFPSREQRDWSKFTAPWYKKLIGPKFNVGAYCGECPLFRHEDTDGFGICHVSSRWQRCSDTCQFLSAPPTPRQAAKILHYAQKWRRGKKCAMLPPAIFGVAIDMAIRTLRKY